jgi:glc operon protein GlcG
MARFPRANQLHSDGWPSGHAGLERSKFVEEGLSTMDTADYTFGTLLLLPLVVARWGILAGQAHARDQGQPVTIALLDATGHLLALERMDGAGWSTVEIALGKAYTALTFGQPSEVVEDQLGAQPGYEAFMASMGIVSRGHFQTFPGGLPLHADGNLLGAVGVSGGADAEVAEAVQREIRHLCEREELAEPSSQPPPQNGEEEETEPSQE